MKPTIIYEEGVVRGALENTVIYGNGAHSQDLQERKFLPTGTEKNTAHHIILPIVTVEMAVRELLLDLRIKQKNIISWASVMAKVPNGIPSVHALWGPAAKTNLKIAVAMETFGESNVLMKHLLAKMADEKIRIIETDKPEHDSKMAVIQGLINLWLVMVGGEENDDLKTKVLQHWKTPAGTIVDMIHANPFAEILIKRFFGSLECHSYNVSNALEGSIRQNLTAADIENFGTPNSDRVMDFISRKTGEIIIPSENIVQLRRQLNTHGHTYLARRIEKIQRRK